MKIAMVSEHASPLAVLGGADAGGQNVHVGTLAAELVRQGHHVVVHTRRDDPRLPDHVVTDCGVVVHHVTAGPPVPIAKDDLLPYMGEFGRVLGEEWAVSPPDVAHAHFWMSGLASLAAAKPLGIPTAQTFHALGVVKRRHQGAADTSPSGRLACEQRIIRLTDRIIATCEDEARELRRLGADSGRIAIVPCGVDLTAFTPGLPPRRQGRPRLLSVGRLVERKGVDDVIAALRWLPGVELAIAGGPPADQLDADPDVIRLQSAATRYGVADRVRFLGRVAHADLPALMRSSDALVSVPLYEPFGIVPLEAMACGLPVVVSSVGGLRESVVHGETGLHVPPGRPDRLAAAVQHLLSDPPSARRLGRAGVRRARALYGWPSVATRTAQIYEELAVAAAGVAVGSQR